MRTGYTRTAIFTLSAVLEIVTITMVRNAAALGSDNQKSIFTGYQLLLDADQVRDDLLVPMRFQGGGGGLGLLMGVRTQNFIMRVELGASASYIIEREKNPGILFTTWLLAEGYYSRFNIWRFVSLSLGAMWRSRITNAMYYSWDDAHLYYLASHLFGPAAAVSFNKFNRATLNLTVRLPFVGFTGRPVAERFVKQEDINAYYLFAAPHKHLSFAMPSQYRAVDISLDVSWSGRRSFYVLRYSVDYERDDVPMPFRRLLHRLCFIQEFSVGGTK